MWQVSRELGFVLDGILLEQGGRRLEREGELGRFGEGEKDGP